MSDLITVDTIISFLKRAAEENQPLPPSKYLDAARSLNALIGDENNRLYDLRHVLAKMLAAYIREGHSVAAARALVEAMDEFRDARKQEARIRQIIEFVRLAKKQAELTREEFRGF